MKEKVRVASGQGFWGDLLTAPVEQVRGGQIDYLMLDYLAEVTMSIVQKQQQRDPNAGYARDFISSDARDFARLRREKHQGHGKRGRRQCSEAAPKPCAKSAKELGLSGKVKNRHRHRRRHSAASRRISRKRRRDNEYGHGRIARRDSRQGSIGKRLSRRAAARRSFKSRRANRHRRTFDRYGLDARAFDARIRLDV